MGSHTHMKLYKIRDPSTIHFLVEVPIDITMFVNLHSIVKLRLQQLPIDARESISLVSIL